MLAQLDPDAESRQRLKLLRGEAAEKPAKPKPKYKTAQEELQEAELREAAEREAQEEEQEPPAKESAAEAAEQIPDAAEPEAVSDEDVGEVFSLVQICFRASLVHISHASGLMPADDMGSPRKWEGLAASDLPIQQLLARKLRACIFGRCRNEHLGCRNEHLG